MKSGTRLKATYRFDEVDHLVRREFSIWPEAIEIWKTKGMPEDADQSELFNFDPPGVAHIKLDLGWCEPPFLPYYEEKIVASEGDTEIFQDFAGRQKRCFTGRRHGFMPTYVKHAVSGREDWEEDVKPRLDPGDLKRYEGLEDSCKKARELDETEDFMVRQGMVGGYMYLRSLVGPEDLLYMLYDSPDLVHDMMKQWAAVMNAGLERIQKHVDIFELAIGEDICYNHGPLISPDMIREFILPYYQDVVGGARKRQKSDLFFHVDTDGLAMPVIPLYLEAGMDVMSPWEVASGCDVVKVGQEWPELVMLGGIDKRVLADSKEAIDKHLEYIIPAMVKRGGYIPTCDHGVPDNVSYDNYMHYRERVCELDH